MNDMWELFEEAVNFQDVDLIWDIWTAMAEAVLPARTTLETGNEIFVQWNRFRRRGHAASIRKVRLGNRGRQFEGVEMHPEKRGLRKMHDLLQEMLWRLMVSISTFTRTVGTTLADWDVNS